MPKRRQKISCKKTTCTVALKKMTEKFNIKTTNEVIKTEAERFLLLFEKIFNECHKKNLKEENLDCEDGIVLTSLIRLQKKSEGRFRQMLKVLRQQSS